MPRVEGADLISVESLNATEGQTQTIRGTQFADLQEYLQTVASAVVDIGASNVEQLLELMRQYRGSNPKVRAKTTLEFISIAYQDRLGATVSTAQLSSLSIAYTAFGDKKLIEDMIIKNLLNEPGAIIPTKASMTADPAKFVDETIKKIFNRNPNEYEKYYFTNLITTNTNVTPEAIYYALMTSEEYRYY